MTTPSSGTSPPAGLRLVGPASPRQATPAADLPLDPALHFAAVFEHAAIGMALMRPGDGRRLRANQAYCRLIGRTEAEVIARSPQEDTHPDDIAEGQDLRRQLEAGAISNYERELRLIHAQGHSVWVQVTVSMLRDGSGAPICAICQVQDITERRLAEEALRASEARFRGLTMLSSDWYWEQDAQLRFTTFQGHARAGAWQPDQQGALGRRRWELPGLQPLSGGWHEHQVQLQARLPFRDFEYVRSLPGEPVRYLSASGEPQFDAAGKFTGYRGVVRDVTHAKMAEQRLRDTQAMLHMAAQVGRLGGWSCDAQGMVFAWSDEMCAIHDVRQGFAPTPEQALSFVAPEFRAAARRSFCACLTTGSPFDLEVEVVTAKGRRIWARVLGEAEWDTQGHVRRVYGACQDVSEQKAAQEDARATGMRLSATLESLTDAFFTLDRQWCFTYLNGEAERLLRLPRTSLLGRGIWERFSQFRGTSVHRQLERAMKEGVTVQFDEHYAPLDIWVHLKAYPSELGLAIYVKDISERRAQQQEIMRLNAQLEQRVQERTAQLEAANRDLKGFSYSIAHDLRAPLGSIEGFSRLLEESLGQEASERSRHYLRRIRAGVHQMGELTEGLLTLARLSHADVLNEAVDLAQLANMAATACLEAAPQRRVDLRIAPSLMAWGDPRLLAQVMGNLVGNAWKFTARTEGAWIEVGVTEMPGEPPVYFVRDNGAGFDMAYAAKLFEAFQRMHASAEFEGNGIGLAIVHKIVTRHGGRIWAEASPQRGATFFFTLAQPVV